MEPKDFVFSDDVTKIFNMRFLLERLKEEIIRAGEVKGYFSIILIDIDHFSAIADTYGRLAADEVLRLFAILLKDFVRKGDIVCTHKGDQFAIILPDADAKRAIRCGSRLLDLLEKKEFVLKSMGKDKLKLSVTMGVASYPNAGRDVGELLDNVSHALKQAKQKTTTKISQYRSLEKERDEKIRLNFDRFIGRDASLSLLKASIEMISHGGVKAYFVTGEIGIGKTRFLLQAMSYAHLIGFCTFYERAFAQKVSDPYFLCKSLLEDITRMFEPQVIMQVVKDLKVWRAGLSWFAPDIFGKGAVDGTHTAEPKRPDKHYLYEAITRFIGEISHYNPLFLFFDDLHWAGQDDIELLQYVIQNSVNSRMLITGAFREEDVVDEKSRLMQVVQDLSRERLIEEIKIGSLSPKELKEFVSVALGLWEVPPDAVNFIQETTEGNPLFIVEILHILIEKGYIYKSGISCNFHKLGEVDLPKRIAGVLADKIKTVHSDTKDLLMTASVIGELFSLQQLMCITGEHEEKLLDLLNEAAKRDIIVSDSEMIGEYRFSYRLLQRVLYDSLPAEKKKNIHEKVADMLAALAEGRDENLEQLAFHYKCANTYERALSYYLSGARKAVEIVAYQKAIELYLEALELAKMLKMSDRSLFGIYYELGCLYTNTGKLYKAQKVFLDSLKLSGVGSGMRMRVFHEIGKIYTKRGGFDTAIEYFQKAKTLLPEIDTVGKATLLSDEAVVYLKRGEYARAFGLARNALQGFGEGDIAEKADVFNTIGNTYFFGGNLEEALKNYNRSLHFARKCFDQRRTAIAHKNIGQIFLEQGRKWDAEKFFKLSLKFAQKVGDLFLIGKVHNDLGVLFMPHDTEKAREHFVSSLRIKRRIGDEDGVAVIFNNIGNLYFREGELAKSLSMFQEALRIWLLMEVQPSLAVTYLNIGGVYYLYKDFEKSFYNTFKGKEIAQSIKFVSGEIAAITNLAQILLEEGKGKGVLELLTEAEKLNTIYKSDDCIINIALLRSRVAFENGDITESKQQYEYIVENVSKIVDRNLEKRVEIFGGRLLIHQEEFEEATRYFERAMMICELAGDVFGMVTVLYYKAVLNVRKKETSDAKQLLLQAKEMLTRHDAKLLSSKVNSLLREIECP